MPPVGRQEQFRVHLLQQAREVSQAPHRLAARPRMYESLPWLETPLHSHSRPFKCSVTFSAGCSGLPGGPPNGSRTGSTAEVLVLLGLDILT